MRKSIFAIAGLALIASGAFASLASVASAADHRDSPNNTANPTSDINDVYAFRSPENANNLVVAISVNPLIVPTDNATRGVFDPAVSYQIHIDRNGDYVDDATVRIRQTTQSQNLEIEGLGTPITAAITPPGADPIIYNANGIKVFAGLRDDPFYFDLSGFQAFIASPSAPAKGLRPASAGNPTDTFAGTNVLGIVIELPVTAVTGGTSANSGAIKVWVSTARGGSRIDRMAIPAINTALIPSASKEAFNQGDPVNDAANFRAMGAASVKGLRAAVDPLFNGPTTEDGGPLGNLSADQVAAALIPDVVSIDFSKPLQFPNGRRLQDDVINADLGIVLNRGGAAGISDGVDANDKAFSQSFPYMADPWTATAAAPAGGSAAAAGAGAAGGAAAAGGSAAAAAPATTVRPPNTGDAGLLHDSDAMWSLSALLFVLAVSLTGAGAFVALRGRSR